MMKNKLFVTDLDGTLLNSQMRLSDYTVKTLNQLIDQGLPITFSTSRSFYTTSMMLKDVHFCLPCITYNGVYVIQADTGEVIRKNLLERVVFDDVRNIAKRFDMKPYIFGKTFDQVEKLVYEEPDNSAQIQFLDERIKRNDKRLTKADASVGDLDELININFLYPLERIHKLEGILRSKYEKQVSIKVIKDIYNEGFYTLEVSNKDANKGKMLEYVANLLGVNMKDITVFGDQANDKEMFDLAGTKIAVNNASEKLKEMADKVIESNDCDGVAKYLREVWENDIKR